jgi:hypothetical protein
MDNEKTTKIPSNQEDEDQTRLIRRVGDTSKIDQPSNSIPPTRLLRRPSVNDLKEVISIAERPICGWLVVVSGPGKGKYAPIFDGMNSVGRDPDEATRIDFGDEGISRSGHAFLTYDFKSRKFFISHGGKPNIVRLNGEPVLEPKQLQAGDLIEISITRLSFIPFCSVSFDWQDT